MSGRLDKWLGHTLQTCLESGLCHLGVAKDFGKQAAPNVFACMDRNNGSTPIGMLPIVLAASHTDNFKTQTLQGSNELAAGKAGQPGHRATLTRWTPTNLLGLGGSPSTSRHKAMAS